MENTTKQIIVEAMVKQLKACTEIHIASYKIAFPHLNLRTLRYYREMAQAELRGELRAGMDLLSKRLDEDAEIILSIERYQNASIAMAFVSGVISSGILFFILR